MKKSFLIVITTIIPISLLIIGHANAMTYTIHGNSTKIAIPKTITGTSIKRCDDCEEINITKDSEECDENNNTGYIECEHTYDNVNDYTVHFDGNNKDFDSLYLDSANINNITNFSGINSITTLYLGNNPGINVGSINFSSIPINNIYLNNNNLSNFENKTIDPDTTTGIYLNNNSLTTIPDDIRDLNHIYWRYILKLSDSISYFPYLGASKIVDLSNNPIRHIKITKVNNTNRNHLSEAYEYSYEFGYADSSQVWFTDPSEIIFTRFGYLYDNDDMPEVVSGGKIRYTYSVSGYDINYSESWTTNKDVLNNGSPTDTALKSFYNIQSGLLPGNYVFKVCAFGREDLCDSIDFKVSYDNERVIIINPDENHEYNSLDIQTQRGRNGKYPYFRLRFTPRENLGGSHSLHYYYEIEKENKNTHQYEQILYQEFTDLYHSSEKNCPYPYYNEFSFYNSLYDRSICIDSFNLGDIIADELNGEDPNGNYKLTVYLEDYESEIIDQTGVYFSINIDTTLPSLTIDEPNNNQVHTQNNINFSWHPTFSNDNYHNYALDHYKYSVTGPNNYSYSNNNTNNTGFRLQNLEDGDYTLTVEMYYTNNGILVTSPITETIDFTMTASESPHASITSPTGNISASNTTTTDVNFSWICGATISHSCEYKLINNSSPNLPIKQGTGDNGQFTQNLGNGNYTFTVNLYDNNHNLLTGDSIEFSVSISKPSGGGGEGNNEKTYTLTINYIYDDGTSATSPYFADFTGGASYSIGSPNINGYTPDQTVVSGTMPNSDKTITVIYSKNIETPQTYTLTINYKYSDGGQASPSVIKNLVAGESYSITSPNISNYTASTSIVKGTMPNSDKTIDIVYTKKVSNGGGGGSSSSNDDYSNDLSIKLGNNNHYTDERIKLIIDVNKKYTGKVYFTKLQYYNTSTSKRTNIYTTSTSYISDYCNDLDIGYVKFTSYDQGRITISKFIKFAKTGKYRIYAEDKDGEDYYIQFTVDGDDNTNNNYNSENSNLSLSVSNSQPKIYDAINITLKTDNYVGKIKLYAKYKDSSDGRTKINNNSSSEYFSDFSNIWETGYYKMTSTDNGKKILYDLIEFKKAGTYRIYAEDEQGYLNYITIEIIGNSTTNTTNIQTKTESSKYNNTGDDIEKLINELLGINTSENQNKSNNNQNNDDVEQNKNNLKNVNDEIYKSRSCKEYTIHYDSSLGAFTSPNLQKTEYFINKEYFKRYIDSKNPQKEGCPNNTGWISTSYEDSSSSTTHFIAPNGKIYFISNESGYYYSNNLTSKKSFSTLPEIRNFIKIRNPLIEMEKLIF